MVPEALAEAEGEGRVVVDWSQQVAGNEPSPDQFELARVIRWESPGSKVELLVVDASTDPPSPFPDGKPALMAKLSEGNSANGGVWLKPFSNPPLQGWMEVEVVLDYELHMAVRVLNESNSHDPKDPDGRLLFGSTMVPGERISLRAEAGVAVDGKPDQPDYLSFPYPIQPGEAARYRVVWDFKAEPPTIGFEINGEEVFRPDGTPFQIEVTPEVASNGLDAFRITGNGFIGNVTVSGEE